MLLLIIILLILFGGFGSYRYGGPIGLGGGIGFLLIVLLILYVVGALPRY